MYVVCGVQTAICQDSYSSSSPRLCPSSETPGGYVGQAVLEKLGVLMGVCFSPTPGGEPLWRIPLPPSQIRLGVLQRRGGEATGGSRELPIASQFYGRIRTNRNALDENITLGRSREPPAATFFSRITIWDEHANS